MPGETVINGAKDSWEDNHCRRRKLGQKTESWASVGTFIEFQSAILHTVGWGLAYTTHESLHYSMPCQKSVHWSICALSRPNWSAENSHGGSFNYSNPDIKCWWHKWNSNILCSDISPLWVNLFTSLSLT